MLRALLLVFTLVGCAPGPVLLRTIDYTREMEQTAIVPAPSGPQMIGPTTPRGAVAKELSATAGASVAPRGTREQGAPGELLAAEWGRARLVAGLTDHLELGVHLSGSPAALARPLATDISTDEFRGNLGRGGIGVRWAWQLPQGVQLGVLGELDGGWVPYLHDETLTTTTTDWSDGVPEVISVDVDTSRAQRATWFWTARGGPHLSVTGAGGDQIGWSTTVENMPFVYGYDRATWSCEVWSDETLCEEEPERRSDVVQYVSWSMTAWLAVPLGEGPWTLLGAVDAHLTRSAMDSGLPASGRVGLRYTPAPAFGPRARGR